MRHCTPSSLFIEASSAGVNGYWSNSALGTHLKALTASDWAVGRRLKLTAGQVAELRQFLHGFLIFHLERLPKGRAAALGG